MTANQNPPEERSEISGDRKEMQSQSRKERHGAYRVERLIRTDEIDGRTRLGQRVRDARLAYAVAHGYATWESVPKPLQSVIKQAVRLELFAERLFAPFWDGAEPPKRFDTVSENLRRALTDMGLEPSRAAAPDVAAMLAGMPGKEARG